MLLVRTPINFWFSFHKNDTVRFQEISIRLSCCLSEIDHLAWMTCLSTSTRAGRWRPKSGFYTINIGSQSPWDNFFFELQERISTRLGVLFQSFFPLEPFVGSSSIAIFFRNVAVETARMRCQMRLLLLSSICLILMIVLVFFSSFFFTLFVQSYFTQCSPKTIRVCARD